MSILQRIGLAPEASSLDGGSIVSKQAKRAARERRSARVRKPAAPKRRSACVEVTFASLARVLEKVPATIRQHAKSGVWPAKDQAKIMAWISAELVKRLDPKKVLWAKERMAYLQEERRLFPERFRQGHREGSGMITAHGAAVALGVIPAKMAAWISGDPELVAKSRTVGRRKERRVYYLEDIRQSLLARGLIGQGKTFKGKVV